MGKGDETSKENPLHTNEKPQTDSETEHFLSTMEWDVEDDLPFEVLSWKGEHDGTEEVWSLLSYQLCGETLRRSVIRSFILDTNSAKNTLLEGTEVTTYYIITVTLLRHSSPRK